MNLCPINYMDLVSKDTGEPGYTYILIRDQ